MADQETPTRGVPLELGGKQLYMRVSLMVRKRIIAEIGGEDKLKKLTGDQIGTVLLQALKASWPEITLDWLEDAIDMQNLEYVTEQLSIAMGQKPKATQGEAPASPEAATETEVSQ